MTVHYWLTMRDLQMMVDKFSQASKLFGLTINISKTKVLYQPAPNTNLQESTITTDSTCLKNIDSFKYVESTISNDVYLDKEIASRIVKQAKHLGELDAECLISIILASLQN